MTDIGEAIAVAAVIQDKDEPCWYCEEQPQKRGVKNEETADPETSESDDEEEVPENDENNDASKLGNNLGPPPNGRSSARLMETKKYRLLLPRITASQAMRL